MSYNDDSSSDVSSDHAWNELIDNMDSLELDDTKGLQNEWEAIERTLYLEQSPPVLLKPALYNECHLWRTSFPYLRVRGFRIEDPYQEKRKRLKNHILTSVVGSIVDKINNFAYSSQEGSKTSHVKVESYFERGKKMEEENKLSSWKTSQDLTTDKANETVKKEPAQPRSILKNSPNRKPITKPRRKLREHTTSNKLPTLPRLNAKKNVWLSRAENCTCGAIESSHSRDSFQSRQKKSNLILPSLINTQSDFDMYNK